MANSYKVPHAILSLLPRAPRLISTPNLCRLLRQQDIDLTERSVQRKLADLSADLPLYCNSDSKPYQWGWEKDAVAVEFPPMSPHTALTLKLVRDHLKHLLPPSAVKTLQRHFKRAEEILGTKPDSVVARWPKKVKVYPRGLNLLSPKIKPAVLSVVYDALLEGRRFRGRYRMRGAEESYDLTINPLGVVVRGPLVTLACTIGKGDGLRQVHLHRFRSAELLAEDAVVPPGFDLERAISEGEMSFRLGRQDIKLVLRVCDVVATTLAETPLSADQVIGESGDDGWSRVRATVADTLELRGWLKSYGPRLEVVSPKRLRKAIAQELAEASALYG